MADAPDLYPGLLLDASEAGPLRWSQRVLPGPVPALSMLAVLAVSSALFYVFEGPTGPIAVLGLAVPLAALVGLHALEVYRVHDHALVVGMQGRRMIPFVVPWETVDPELVRLHTRANFVARRIGVNTRRNVRQPPWSRTAVSVVGLGPDYASPRLRAAKLPLVRRQLASGQQPLMPLPLAPWYLGTRKPEPLLRALEAALVEAGQKGAHGLADRCLAAPVRERYRTPLTEQQVYGRTVPRRLTG